MSIPSNVSLRFGHARSLTLFRSHSPSHTPIPVSISHSGSQACVLDLLCPVSHAQSLMLLLGVQCLTPGPSPTLRQCRSSSCHRRPFHFQILTLSPTLACCLSHLPLSMYLHRIWGGLAIPYPNRRIVLGYVGERRALQRQGFVLVPVFHQLFMATCPNGLPDHGMPDTSQADFLLQQEGVEGGLPTHGDGTANS